MKNVSMTFRNSQNANISLNFLSPIANKCNLFPALESLQQLIYANMETDLFKYNDEFT